MAKLVLVSESGEGLTSAELKAQYPNIGAVRDPGSNGLNPSFSYLPIEKTYDVQEMNGQKYGTVKMKKIVKNKVSEAVISVGNFTKYLMIDGVKTFLMDTSILANVDQNIDSPIAICDEMLASKDNLTIVGNGSIVAQGAYDAAPRNYSMFKVAKATKEQESLFLVK